MRFRWSILLLALGVLPAAGVLWWLGEGEAPEGLCDALARVNVVRVAVAPGLSHPQCEGLEAADARDADLTATLEDGAQDFADWLRKRNVGALLVGPGRAASLTPDAGARALYLGRAREAFVARNPVELSAEAQRVLARVARGLLRGEPEPRLSAFPRTMRQVRRVEVMVLLRRGGQARLWRSARGRSVAQALLTATRVARERWAERQSAMGGPLAAALHELTVEVLWLREEGDLESGERSFVDARVPPGMGLGIDYRNGWHYVLPRTIEAEGGSAHAALVARLDGQGIAASALREPGSRLYRFQPVSLGVSPPSDEPSLAEALGGGRAGSATGSRTVNALP